MRVGPEKGGPAMATTILSDNTLTVEPQINQETDLIVAVATRIYDVGAVYSPVESGMYKLQLPDSADDGVIVSAHQFHLILSLVHSLKSHRTIPV